MIPDVLGIGLSDFCDEFEFPLIFTDVVIWVFDDLAFFTLLTGTSLVVFIDIIKIDFLLADCSVNTHVMDFLSRIPARNGGTKRLRLLFITPVMVLSLNKEADFVSCSSDFVSWLVCGRLFSGGVSSIGCGSCQGLSMVPLY